MGPELLLCLVLLLLVGQFLRLSLLEDLIVPTVGVQRARVQEQDVGGDNVQEVLVVRDDQKSCGPALWSTG